MTHLLYFLDQSQSKSQQLCLESHLREKLQVTETHAAKIVLKHAKMSFFLVLLNV